MEPERSRMTPGSTISCLSPGANAFIFPGLGSSPGAQTSHGVAGTLKIHPDVCSASSGSPRAFKSKRCPSTNALEMGSRYVSQAGLELLDLNPPASASQSAGIPGVRVKLRTADKAGIQLLRLSPASHRCPPHRQTPRLRPPPPTAPARLVALPIFQALCSRLLSAVPSLSTAFVGDLLSSIKIQLFHEAFLDLCGPGRPCPLGQLLLLQLEGRRSQVLAEDTAAPCLHAPNFSSLPLLQAVPFF
ncbi:uncharacterized protein LOC134728828 isoform X2 [Pan paniscus]|uniref:uncharacterized protein LOC134728828 isoform X2 n=1 Tax=Pan paniscus TaxID=9597 RepID=UPI003003F385